MKEIKEISFNENDISLERVLVRGSILPQKAKELNRVITIQGETVIEGAVYGYKMEIQNGPVDLQGTVFTNLELYVNSDAKGDIVFRRSVGSADSIVSRAKGAQLSFYSDINANKVTLCNTFVAGSIYGDHIVLDNCVVVGGVFATQSLEMTNCIVGTFNSPEVSVYENISLLLPSAFSVEDIVHSSDSKFYNLSLADLGALYRGVEQSRDSGRIELDFKADTVDSTLTDEEMQTKLKSYTVIGKVLAADLIDMDKFQNHFLLTSASLGMQLLSVYDMGPDAEGNPVELSLPKIRKFFFDILNGNVDIQPLSGTFDLQDLVNQYN